MKKLTVEITNEEGNIGIMLTRDKQVLDWNILDRDEQVQILNTIASSYGLFRRFLKED